MTIEVALNPEEEVEGHPFDEQPNGFGVVDYGYWHPNASSNGGPLFVPICVGCHSLKAPNMVEGQLFLCLVCSGDDPWN